MKDYSNKQIRKGRFKFITMSLIGIILFLIPIPVKMDGESQTSLPVAYLASLLKVYLKAGSKMIYSEDTGGLVFGDLLPTLVSVFFFAALFLPLLMEYGLLELLGPIFRPVMRPLFTLPGRSTVDNLASFIGDGTVGVLITSRQYEKGIYSRREATVISTTFSVVSLTFAIVIAFLLFLFYSHRLMYRLCIYPAAYLAA